MPDQPSTAPSAQGPLAGLRVLELGQGLSGPFTGAIFSDLGAEVVKLERVDGGDDAPLLGADNTRHGLPECGPSSNQEGD